MPDVSDTGAATPSEDGREPAKNLAVNGGFLILLSPTFPTRDVGLEPGALWSNDGVVCIVPGNTPVPDASPIFFHLLTASQLLAIGGADLPLSKPADGSGQLWNNGGSVCVA